MSAHNHMKAADRCDVRSCPNAAEHTYWHRQRGTYLRMCDDHRLEDWIGNE